jgi:hypothetical protein
VGRVRDFLRKEPGDFFFGPVQYSDGTMPGTQRMPGTPVEPESAYLGLYLESMRISAVRVRGQAFYGSVTSTCALQSRSGQRAEVIAVSTPNSLRGVDPKHLDRVVVGTVPLVDAVPYRGGGLDVEIGLFAFPGGYLTGPYLDLLSDIATVASAFLPPAGALASTALMPPVRKGLDLLFGAATDVHLEVGLAHTWQTPATGYYAVVRAPEPLGGFRVAADGHLLGPQSSEVRAPHLVLRLDAQRERHNWTEIPDVYAAYQIVADAARRGDLVAARDALASFRRVAVFSPDLLIADGERLHDMVAEQVKLAFPATGTRGGVPSRSFPDLTEIQLYENPGTRESP